MLLSRPKVESSRSGIAVDTLFGSRVQLACYHERQDATLSDGTGQMSGEVNVVALVRGDEQYVFVFDERRRTELLRLLGRYAADPELAFSWYDAAVLSQKIREMRPAHVTESVGGGKSLQSADLYPSDFPKISAPPRIQFPEG
jgi:hypothetical protein